MTKPLLLLHGLFGGLGFPEIQASFPAGSVLAMDRLGYGENRAASRETLTISSQLPRIYEQVAQKFPQQKVHVLGHSMGGVVGAYFVDRYPDLVASFISVEGNFTLKDAFMCKRYSAMTLEEVEKVIAGYRADPAGWMRAAVGSPPLGMIERAAAALEFQPAATIKAWAEEVIKETGHPNYIHMLERIFDRHPVYLLAGEKSRQGWDIPNWALKKAAGYFEFPERGHLMMWEEPAEFGRVIAGLIHKGDGQSI